MQEEPMEIDELDEPMEIDDPFETGQMEKK